MEKADEAENEELKDALVDTLLNLYDLRIANFGEEGKVLGMKGVDLMKYRKKDPAAAFEILNKSFELDGNNIGVSVTTAQDSFSSTFKFKSSKIIF